MSHINANSRKARKRALNGAHRQGPPMGRVAFMPHAEAAPMSMGAAAMAIAMSMMNVFKRGGQR